MTHATIPIDKVYLAILPRPIMRGRARDEEIRHAFEPMIPGSLDRIRIVQHSLQDDRVLAFGITDEALAVLPPKVTAASPEGWPEELTEQLGGLAPDSINLLVGPAEPSSVRKVRDRLWMHLGLGILLLSVCMMLLIEQRIAFYAESSQQARDMTRAVHVEALGSASVGSRQPLASLVTSDLRKLRATRTGPNQTRSSGPSSPADLMLAAILKHWPPAAEARTDSITVSPRSIEISATVPTLSHAGTLVQAMRSVPDVVFGGESTARDRDRIRITIRLAREDQP
ncbi:MAG: hypothetical protein AAGA55_08910 [Planctomycetota bacterium]